jgi:hypothetical protein
MKTFILFSICFIVFTTELFAQKIIYLSKNQIDVGKIVYQEDFDDSTTLNHAYNHYKKSKIILTDETKDIDLKIKGEITQSNSSGQVFIKFTNPILKDMADDDFSLSVNDTIIAKSDTTSFAGKNEFKFDIKPAFDTDEPQKLDVNWDRTFYNGSLIFSAKGNFSTKTDSAALNSVQFKTGYSLIWNDCGVFKYFGLSGEIHSEHPQDFSQTNLVGSIVGSSIIPGLGSLARILFRSNNIITVDFLIQPAIEFVKNTSVKDSSFIRGAIHCGWDIPLLKNQYLCLYGVAYFQNGYRPRSYIEMTFEQDISQSIAVIGKWVNGELPPLFKRESDFRIGLRFK